MNRLAILTATAMLATPAAAHAATGIVLSVDGHGHSLELVDGARHVHALRWRGATGHLQPGALISYSGSGTARHLRVLTGGSHAASFGARVVRTSRQGIVLVLADGRRVSFTAGELRAGRRRGARPLGLFAGAPVTVTVTAGARGMSVSVTIAPASAGTGGTAGTGGRASGGTSGGDGSSVADGSGGTDGSGGPDGSSGVDGSTQDAVGTITALTPTGLTILGTDGTPRSFAVHVPNLLDSFSVGDEVDVSYDILAPGVLGVSDVEWVQHEVTGAVTAVTGSSLTLTPDGGGAPMTFTTDPSSGNFDGVNVGDPVDVSYHMSGTGPVLGTFTDTAGG